MSCRFCNSKSHEENMPSDDLTNAEICQLHQLDAERFRGVWAGNLMDKEATRSLLRKGYAEGSHPSALDQVYISKKGRDQIKEWETLISAASKEDR